MECSRIIDCSSPRISGGNFDSPGKEKKPWSSCSIFAIVWLSEILRSEGQIPITEVMGRACALSKVVCGVDVTYRVACKASLIVVWAAYYRDSTPPCEAYGGLGSIFGIRNLIWKL